MIEVQKLENLIASLIQFGPSPDGSVERDIDAAIARFRAENERLTAKYDRACKECFEATTKLVAAEAREAKAVEDAARWNALLRCARIRMQGSAGFDPKTGERHEYNNITGQYEKSDKGWVHFGAEFWSVYPGHDDEDKDSRWGTLALIALADDVLLKEAEAVRALPTEVQNDA